MIVGSYVFLLRAHWLLEFSNCYLFIYEFIFEVFHVEVLVMFYLLFYFPFEEIQLVCSSLYLIYFKFFIDVVLLNEFSPFFSLS